MKAPKIKKKPEKNVTTTSITILSISVMVCIVSKVCCIKFLNYKELKQTFVNEHRFSRSSITYW